MRVEASRLRRKLAQYYAGPGADSSVRITIPKGHYRPTFLTPANDGNGLDLRGATIAPAVVKASVAIHDSRAVDCYHRGQYAARQRDAGMYAKAVELFRRAIALDPRFAAPYAALAMALLNIAGFVMSPSAPLLIEAAEAAQGALALDPESADAYTALAAFMHRFHWDWAKAERLFERALAVGPESAVAHASFAFALTARGRFAEAEQHICCARELDPINVGLRAGQAQILYYARRHAEAEAQLAGLLEIAPKHAFAEWLSGVNALYSGQPQAARAAFERASAIFPDHPSPRLLVTATLALEGRDREALDHLATLLANLGRQYCCKYHLAIAYAYLGDRNRMYAALDDAAAVRDALLVNLPVEPAFHAYHSEARFRSFRDARGFASLEA